MAVSGALSRAPPWAVITNWIGADNPRIRECYRSFRYSRSRIAFRLSAFASDSDFRSSALRCRLSSSGVPSGALHSGHRLANPGLSGFNSNSSPQTTHVLIGKLILIILSESIFPPVILSPAPLRQTDVKQKGPSTGLFGPRCTSIHFDQIRVRGYPERSQLRGG